MHNVIIRPANELPLREARRILKYKGPDAEEFLLDEEKGRDFGHFVVQLEYYSTSVLFLLMNRTFQYFLFYIALSFLGWRVSPIFYSFQLLDVINRISTLKNVIQSVTTNADQLLLTAMLGVIFILIFSSFGFEFLWEMYYDDEIRRAIPN